jgi:5-(carboxyamino)imidazole ribonucleotide mutase
MSPEVIKGPLVGIIMGSDSDLPVMKESAEMLAYFGIPYEITVISAHRTPERAFEYARSAEIRGLSVIIAGAGGAAHLPGIIAALTPLPVIGVPILSKSLSGMDSLFSIVQMPKGIPVAAVAINGAANAGILAAEMLGAGGNADLRGKIKDYKAKLKDEVALKAKNVEESFKFL